MTTPNPLEKLTSLASVRALLSALDERTEIGDEATARGATLRRVLIKSNVGTCDYWRLSRDEGAYECERACLLDYDLDGEGYLHGDFNAPLRGPSRADLLAFATRAEAFLDDLISEREAESAALDAASASIQRAAEAMK
jgi:hypothetical protein